MSGKNRSKDYRRLASGMVRGGILLAGCTMPVMLALFSAAPLARAQATPSFVAANAYNAQPGTVPIQVATGVFNNAGGLLDFAVLEQVPNASSYQVEIYHGESGGSFCTNCGGASPDPDLIPLGSGVTGNAIAVGQFMSSGPLDIAVATNTGIDFLENNGSGTFTLSPYSIPSANGFVSLAVGLFHGDGNYDIAAVTPSVSGSIGFTVFFGNGSRTFPTQSSSYPVGSTYVRCSAIMQGNFQSQTNSADLALECNNPSLASVLVYLNSGSGAFTLNQTLSSGSAFGGVVPGVALGALNSQAAIFIASPSNSFVSYQSNGLTGVANAFTSVSMIPVGLAPRGSIAVLNNPLTGAVDFDVNGAAISTFTSYTQSGTSVNGTWNSTAAMGPGGVFAAASSPNLTPGATTYVMVDASVSDGEYTNFYPFLEERSINVFLVTFNADGTFASTNAAPLYSGTGVNGYSFPPSFATGDFNGDGQTDLAVTGADDATGDATLTIYLANPDGSLPAITSTPASVVTVSNTDYLGADAVVAGKFRPPQSGLTLYDLAVFSSDQIFVLPSNGDGTFGAGVSYPLSGDPNYPGFRYIPSAGAPFPPVLLATDVNGDGLDDIVLILPEDNCNASGSPSQGAVYVLISNGDGTFQSPVFVAPPVVNPVSAVAANFFGRAVPDLVIADGGEFCSGNAASTTGTAVGMLQNNIPLGSGSISSSNFTPAAILMQSSDLSMPDVTAVATADLNGDGKPDLAVSGANGIQILLNQGGGSFTATAQGVFPLYAGDVVPGPLCNSADNYVGCVSYVSQVATGSFFAAGENDVAASVNGVAYIFQNQGAGKLSPPAQGFVAGPNSTMISAALTSSNGLNGLLVATSQGTAYLANGSGTSAPSVSPTPSILPFGSENMGTTSAPLTVTLTNSGTASLILSTVTVGGMNAGDFAKSTDSCTGATVTPKSTCTVGVTFTPSATGSQAGSLSFTDNASNSPQTLGLTGTGVCQPIIMGPSTLAPGTVGTPYGPVTFTENGGVGATTFSESGTLPTGVTFSAPLLSGTTTQSGSFPITVTATDSNQCPGTITDTLTINSVTISPAVVTDNETITVSDTETFPDVADSESITVTDGVTVTPLLNITAPVASFSTSSLGFGAVAAGTSGTQIIRVSNVGQSQTELTLSSALISPLGTPFSLGTISCSNGATSFPTTLPSGGACVVSISYAAPASGTPPSAAITFTDNAGLSNLTSTPSGSSYTQTISLNPGGTTAPQPTEPLATVPVSDSETITVGDTEIFPDLADSESISVTDHVNIMVSQTITFGAPPTVVVGGSGTLSATASSGLPVTFSSTTPAICSVSGSSVSGLAVGSCIVAANQSGNANFIAAPQVTQAISVNPSAGLFPATLNFADQLVGSVSPTQIVTLTNAGTTKLTVGVISTTPDFIHPSKTCTATLAAGTSCTISVAFAPKSKGPLNGTLTVGTNGTVALSGVGITPTASLTPATYTFANQQVDTTSAAQSFTYSNIGLVPITVSSAALGGVNPGNYAIVSDACSGLTLPPSATCDVSVTFTPSAANSRVAMLTVRDKTGGAAKATASLSGTGVAAAATLTGSAAFGSLQVGVTSAQQTFTYQNIGLGPIMVNSAALIGSAATNYVIASDTCTGATVAPSSACSVALTFTPSKVGSRTAILSVIDSTRGAAAQSLGLSGTGIAPSVSLGAGTYAYGPVPVATAATFTLTNSGTAPLMINTIALTTVTQFSVTGGTCAVGVNVSAGGSCTVVVTFTPSGTIAFTDTLIVSGTGLGIGAPTYTAARVMTGR